MPLFIYAVCQPCFYAALPYHSMNEASIICWLAYGLAETYHNPNVKGFTDLIIVPSFSKRCWHLPLEIVAKLQASPMIDSLYKRNIALRQHSTYTELSSIFLTKISLYARTKRDLFFVDDLKQVAAAGT